MLVDGATDVDGVTSGACYLADDGPFLTQHGVDDRGLACVGSADDGQFQRACISLDGDGLDVVGPFLETQFIANHADEFIDPEAMGGADFHLFLESETGEFGTPHFSLGGVRLVADENHRLARFPQFGGEGLINGGDAIDDIDDKE